ncbi:cytochrome c oxidase assembly protein COX18, mitochondrial-like isoform X1 [Protopterus annectens]|uniref:cytochrome c oxidase assembly protein COX18, mitochondrial-like isoform X1 n=1 Tax=Protopterus annectens TaxID=7888 RepID=UPI001CFC4518|nr:cytochrome c oxidase assembly protein COX18, mitochondrial-like isoform X1 [Protopterus annectens]
MCCGLLCKMPNMYSLSNWYILQQRTTKRTFCLVATFSFKYSNGNSNSDLKCGDSSTRLGTNSKHLFRMFFGCCAPHLGRTLTSACKLSSASVSTDWPGWYEYLADSAPAHVTQDFLVGVQQLSGLPWWATIICSTIAIRAVITLPLAAYQLYVIAKIENLQPEIENLAKHLRYEVSFHAKQQGWSEKLAR